MATVEAGQSRQIVDIKSLIEQDKKITAVDAPKGETDGQLQEAKETERPCHVPSRCVTVGNATLVGASTPSD